ncbi:MAG TPA: hypothetical protein PKE66_04675 [Pyrinomonadaceae bacterium]|nr:hypothetical protein [Pyrinomonadaceae bacterium]
MDTSTGYQPYNIPGPLPFAALTVRVNESGYFEIYDLPRGEYVVEFETPEGWKLGSRYHSGFTTYPNRFDDEGLSTNQRRVVMGEGHYTLDFSLELNSAN